MTDQDDWEADVISTEVKIAGGVWVLSTREVGVDGDVMVEIDAQVGSVVNLRALDQAVQVLKSHQRETDMMKREALDV